MSAINLLANGGFEGGVWRRTHSDEEFPEISVPLSWVAFWEPALGRPEMKVIAALAPFLDPPRVAEGRQALMWFTFYRTQDAGVYQQVSVPSGSAVRLTAMAHAWYSQRDEAHLSEWQDEAGVWHVIQDGDPGMLLEVGLDPLGGVDWRAERVVWQGAHSYSGPEKISLEVAGCSGTVTVFLRSLAAHPFKHCDAYWDGVQLELVDVPLPPAEPEPGVDYVVVVNLLPQDTTEAEFAHVLSATYEGRESLVYSADDAARLVAPGPPGSYVMVWGAWRWTQGDIEEYLHDRGVSEVRFSPLGIPPGPEPEPQPEPPTGSGFSNLPKALSAGMHFTAALPPCWAQYIGEGKPSVVKGFSAGDVYRMGKWARVASPGTRTIWRKHVSDGEWITGNLHDKAQAYLDQYKVEAGTAAVNLKVSLPELWGHINYIAGLNELISNWSPLTETQVEFECWFATLIDEQMGSGVKATMLAVPVGNPNHDPVDIERMLPAAEMSAEHGHLLDYHAYWTAGKEPGRSYLDQEWEWLAGRWTKWDAAFATFGVAPRYVFGESGMVYDPTGGTWVGSGGSWKAAGSVLYLREQVQRMNELVTAWNATHNNRCLGGVLFTCEKTYGWDEFLLGNGDLLEMLQWMVTL